MQALYDRLHRSALAGMGFGLAEVAESGEQTLLRSLAVTQDATTVFDVGANVGSWTLAALRAWPGAEVHAFEPSASTHRDLAAVCEGRSVRCIPMALSDRAGKGVLHQVPGLSGLSSLHMRDLIEHGFEMSHAEPISLTTLDDYCAGAEIQHIDILKIDVEGHDLAVLHGSRRMLKAGAIGMIQFEFGGANLDSRTYLRDFVRLLEGDFDLYRVVVDGLVPLVYRERKEIFVTSNYLAIRRQRGLER